MPIGSPSFTASDVVGLKVTGLAFGHIMALPEESAICQRGAS
ncbi:MAG: hypothetical protein ACREHG_06535 [Candidatus Saccharimonadales bacterium]